MTKLSDQALTDLAKFASEHAFVAAFSVLQLVDDQDQCNIVALEITKTMLAMTARLAEAASPELNYERLIKSFADQIVELALTPKEEATDVRLHSASG